MADDNHSFPPCPFQHRHRKIASLGGMAVPLAAVALAGAEWLTGSVLDSQPAKASTSSPQPPQPVAARVAAHRAGRLFAPSYQASRSWALVTMLQRHTIA